VSPSRRVSLAERIYRALLFVYPPAFRRRLGGEMSRAFRDLLRAETERRGGRGALPALFGAAVDVLQTASPLWLEAIHRGPDPAGAVLGASPPGLGGFAQDLRYALRGLRRQPSFTLVATATLALGIGANTALFSILDAVLLQPLPYGEPDRLVAIFDTHAAQGRGHEHPSPGNFLDWRANSRAFEAMAAWQDGSGTATLRGDHEATVVETVKVTSDFFRVMGVPPALGRTFGGDGEPGAAFDVADRYAGGDRVVVMSHGLWTRRFGADPAVVGRVLDLDGAPWRVAGVMSAGFDVPRETTELWIPWDIVPSYASFPAGPPRDFRFLNVLARLRSDVSLERSEQDLQALAAALAERHPKANAGWSARVVPLKEEIVGRARPVILLLFGAVGLVLLLACANVASLQLARAFARRREMAVRLALGASRLRLLRQLLTESALLGVLGGLAGLLVAYAGLYAVLAARPEGLPRLAEVALSVRVFAFSALLSLLASVLFGLVPALEALHAPVAISLQESGRGATASRRARRARRALIVSEVAMALVLLTGAGLLVRSFVNVLGVDPGFDPRGLAVMRIGLDHATYKKGAQAREFYRELTRRLEVLPGIVAAGAVTALPFSPVGTDFSRPYWREGEADPGGDAPKTDIRMATPAYFDAMRMTIRQGRPFTVADGPEATRVIVVNEAMARRVWPGRSAVGQRLVLDYLGGAYPYEVIGVVSDTRFRGLKAAPRPEVFIPHAQNPYLDLSLVVRTSGDPGPMLRTVQQEIRAVDPLQPAYGLVTMDDLVRRSVSADRFTMLVLALLASLALVLAATGIYGVLSFLVAQRTSEIGLRLALGASPRQVVGLVMGETLRLTLAGSAAGLLVSLALVRTASRLLYGVGPTDPVAFGLALLFMGAVAAAASLPPARRASRLDPVIALRAE
jgi:putative ABC transport system permease protein